MTTTRRPARNADANGRRSPGRPPVPAERIVATALQIIDEEGANALSMRTLAVRLGSSTAMLYRHLADRAELIARVVDRVLAEVKLNTEEFTAMSWHEAYRTAAHALFEAVGRHKNVAPLLVEQVPIGPNAMAHRERCIAVLLDNGFPPHLAALAYTTLARYVLGFAIQLNTPGTAAQLDDAQLSAAFHRLDQSLFPATVAVADSLPVSLEEEFAFGLELLLKGLGQLRGGRKRRKT
jgi:TetR/AcrR family tetracycline transcriptional repressor